MATIRDAVRIFALDLLIQRANKNGLLCTVLPVMGVMSIQEGSRIYLGTFDVSLENTRVHLGSLKITITVNETLHLARVQWGGSEMLFYVSNPAVFS